MAIRVVCASCNRAVRVADDLAGRKIRCPDCDEPIAVVAQAASEAKPRSAPARPTVDREATTPTSSRRSPTRSRPAPPVTETEPNDSDEPEVKVRRAPKPKRKKRRRRERETETSYDWLWWVACGVTAVAAVGILFAVARAKDDMTLILFYGVALGIMLVISTGILIVSMIITSAITGGIDFGEIHIVIPKAITLLLIVDLIILLVPFGGFITLPIWIAGLMIFFRLDFWETRLLFIVNWALNYVGRWALMAMLMSHAAHVAEQRNRPDAPPPSGQQTEPADGAFQDD